MKDQKYEISNVEIHFNYNIVLIHYLLQLPLSSSHYQENSNKADNQNTSMQRKN